jgi:hypothetical protein
MAFKASNDRIKNILGRRLCPLKPGEGAPPILDGRPTSWITFGDEHFLGLLLVDKEAMARIASYVTKNFHPLPGFITTDREQKAAFRVEKSKNGIFSQCVVTNLFSFSLGPDTTFVVVGHRQILKGTAEGDLEYEVPLAYIVSFGEEITNENVYEYLDDLIAYSVKSWRKSDDSH